ncbi:MAG TPA: carboxypeptidase regulatory-like domain-containing protein [Acidobacteriaceae bacterium]|nr:carboxypeptidase regulatory-like domain-containing protein [Acidobacteriaceae bacterium]
MKRPSILAIASLALLAGCSRNSGTTASTGPATPAAPAYFHVDPATAGSVSGTVRWSGRRPAPVRVDMSSDPACVSANKGPVYEDSLVVGRQGQLANAFVYIKSGLEGKTFEPPSTPATLDQRGCWFHPHVLGLQVGQEIDIVNSDPVTHNIHPMAHINREWNHSQGPGDAPLQRRFLKPEVMVPVKCNIHGWMHAYIGVVDNPYFAVTGSDGSFTLPNLPAGTYTIAIWHENSAPQEQQIVIQPHQNTAVHFDLK